MRSTTSTLKTYAVIGLLLAGVGYYFLPYKVSLPTRQTYSRSAITVVTEFMMDYPGELEYNVGGELLQYSLMELRSPQSRTFVLRDGTPFKVTVFQWEHVKSCKIILNGMIADQTGPIGRDTISCSLPW